MPEESKLVNQEYDNFEKYWETTEIYKKSVTSNGLQSVDVEYFRYKDVAWLSWEASSQVFRGPSGASG